MQQWADWPRAARYELVAEVVYRRVGDGEQGWREGRTVNVSRSGVLFHAPAPALAPTTRVEFVLLLPALGVPGRSRVHCQGRVVRQAQEPPGGGCAMAATIEAYELRGSAADPFVGRMVVEDAPDQAAETLTTPSDRVKER